MQISANVSTIAGAIQLAVAPVFLLSGIGALLAVMANRLSRVVDRFRVLSETENMLHFEKDREMDVLLQRSRWVHWAISLSAISELLICIVVAALFIGSELKSDPSRVISLLFIAAMLTLIIGLLCFLREIFLSTDTIKKTAPKNRDLKREVKY